LGLTSNKSRIKYKLEQVRASLNVIKLSFAKERSNTAIGTWQPVHCFDHGEAKATAELPRALSVTSIVH